MRQLSPMAGHWAWAMGAPRPHAHSQPLHAFGAHYLVISLRRQPPVHFVICIPPAVWSPRSNTDIYNNYAESFAAGAK